MRKARVLLAICVLLALPSALLAQRGAQRTDAGSKDAFKAALRPARGAMAGQRAAIGRLQQSALKVANGIARKSQSRGATGAWLKAQALQIRTDLQSALQHMDQADRMATAAEKRHIAQLRSHDQTALGVAEELVTEAQKSRPDLSVIRERAQAIYKEIETAGTVTATDDWSS